MSCTTLVVGTTIVKVTRVVLVDRPGSESGRGGVLVSPSQEYETTRRLETIKITVRKVTANKRDVSVSPKGRSVRL